MACRRRDAGSTSAIGLSVAAASFAIAFLTANLMVAKPSGTDPEATSLDMTASTALDVVVGDAGRRGASAAAWIAEPDDIGRFGLAEEGKPNFLDYRKIKLLRNGTMVAASNDAPDYTDVRAGLGLDGMDLHLRTYPVIPGMDDPRWTKEARGRFAYIAHDAGSSEPAGSATVTTTTFTHDRINVSVAIRNDGAKAYVFSATIALGKESAGAVVADDERHTRLLAPGETQTVWVDFPRMAYTTTPDGVRVTLADAAGRIITGPTWTAATPPSTGPSFTVGVKAAAGARYYLPTEQVTFHLDRYDASGNIPDATVTWRFVLVKPDGSEINTTVELKKKKSASYTCTSCTALGLYNGYFYNADMTLRAHDLVQVIASAPSSGEPVFNGVSGKEIALVSQLVSNFNPTLYDATTNPAGDVFDDADKVRELAPLLSRYTTLIVGSGVEQNALNSGDIKWPIANWVIGGGNLMVLGRDSGHANWLQPVYKASIAGAGGGIGAPDPTHPILTTPNRLDYQRYNDHGLAWGIRQDQPFTHVLTRGVAGSERQDALAVANPGAYNNGSVVLTSYMPGALTTPQDDKEALKFLHNLMSQSYNMLFLDYGPPVPDDTLVGSAQRLAAVAHPSVPNAVVEVRIVMYTWR